MKRRAAILLLAAVATSIVSITAISPPSAAAVEPVAIAQTTSAVSSKPFLSTPAPDLQTQDASASLVASSTASLVFTPTGHLSPIFGAVVLVLVVAFGAAVLLWRRRIRVRA